MASPLTRHPSSPLAALLAVLLTAPALAAEQGSAGIPTMPTTPPQLAHRAPPDLFRCQRRFTYDGKVYNCDSNLYNDGEGLRPILKRTPAAITELDLYQSNRRKVSTLAYVGSAGLAVTLAALVVSKFMADSNGTITNEGRTVRNVGGFGGISITVGSLVYGWFLLRNNEDHLGRAVQFHNDAHPDKPIEVRLNAGVPIF